MADIKAIIAIRMGLEPPSSPVQTPMPSPPSSAKAARDENDPPPNPRAKASTNKTREVPDKEETQNDKVNSAGNEDSQDPEILEASPPGTPQPCDGKGSGKGVKGGRGRGRGPGPGRGRGLKRPSSACEPSTSPMKRPAAAVPPNHDDSTPGEIPSKDSDAAGEAAPETKTVDNKTVDNKEKEKPEKPVDNKEVDKTEKTTRKKAESSLLSKNGTWEARLAKFPGC